MAQQIKNILVFARNDLQVSLKSLEQAKKKQAEESQAKTIKIILATILEKNQQQLSQQLTKFQDQQITDSCKSIIDKMTNKVASPATTIVQEKVTVVRQSKITTQNNGNKKDRSSSIVKSILGKFVKQDQNVRQMILPDNEPQGKYDPVAKKWIFEGQEQEQKKEIPKPPPKKIGGSKAAGASKKSPSEIDSLIAPPTFKRKGGNKNKEGNEKKQQKIVTFDKFSEKIFTDFQNLEQNLIRIFMTFPQPNKQTHSKEKQLQEQVHSLQEKLRHQNTTINSGFLQTIDHKINSFTKRLDLLSSESISLGQQFEEDKTVQNLALIKKQILNLGISNSQILEVIQNYHLQKNTIKIESIQEGEQQIEKIAQQMEHYKLRANQYEELLTFEKKTSEKSHENFKELSCKYDELLKLYHEIKQVSNEKMIQFEAKEEKWEREISSKHKHIKELETAYENKTAEALKYTEQLNILEREINSLNQQEQTWNIVYEGLKEHIRRSDLYQKFNETLTAENELLRKIQQKRHHISSQQNLSSSSSSLSDSPSQTEHESQKVLSLSETLSRITSNLSQKLLTAQSNVEFLQQKYNLAQCQLIKLKQSSSKEAQSLQRTIQRVKSLNETYKQCIDESNIKIIKLTDSNEQINSKISGLKKQIENYKKLLESNIKQSQENSRIHKQELSRELEELTIQYENKAEEVEILEKELNEANEQLRESLERVMSLEKRNTDQFHEIKKLKESESELEEVVEKVEKEKQKIEFQLKEKQKRLQKLMRQHQDQIEKIRDENKKLAQQLSQRLADKEKELKQLQGLLENSKKQNDELLQLVESANSQNEEYKNRITQLQQSFNISQHQNQQISQLNNQISLLKNSKSKYEHNLQLLTVTIKEQQEKIDEYSQLILEQSRVSQMLTNQLFSHKKQLEQSQINMIEKFERLSSVLQQNQQEKVVLLNQLKAYQNLLNSALEKIQKTESLEKTQQRNASIQQSLQKQRAKIEELENEIKQNEENLQVLTQELADKEDQLAVKGDQINLKMELLKDKEEAYERLVYDLNLSTEDNHAMTKQLSEIKMNLSKLIGQIQEVRKEKENICQSQHTIKQQKIELEEKIAQISSEYENRIKQGQAREKELSVKISEQQQLLLALESDKQKMEEKLLSTSDRLENLLIQLSKVEKQLSEKSEECNQLQSSLSNRGQEQKNSLNEQLQRSKEDVAQLLVTLEALENEKKQCEQKLNSEISGLKGEISVLNIDLIKKSKETDQIIEEKQRQLSEVKLNLLTEEQKVLECSESIKELKESIKKQNKIIYVLKIILKIVDKSMGEKNILIENQSKQIQKYQANSESHSSDEVTQLHQLLIQQEETLQAANNELDKIKKEKLDLQKQNEEKKEDLEKSQRKLKQADKVIGQFEEKERHFKKIQGELKKLEEQYKKLEMEAMDLEKDKKDLMNQKQELVKKIYAKEKQSAQKPKQRENVVQNGVKERVKGEEKERRGKEMKVEEEKMGGFFGSLSSIFLTSKETEKLVRK